MANVAAQSMRVIGNALFLLMTSIKKNLDREWNSQGSTLEIIFLLKSRIFSFPNFFLNDLSVFGKSIFFEFAIKGGSSNV